VQLFAELVAMRIQLGDGDRSFLLATPDFGVPDGDVLGLVETFAGEDPAMGFGTLSTVRGTTDTMEVSGEPLRVELPAAAGADLTARVAQVDELRLYAASTASMLPDDDPRRAAWDETLDQLVSTSVDDAEAEATMAALRTEVDAVVADVVPPEPFTFTLTGRSSEIVLPIENRGPTPLRVVVQLGSTKLTFPEGGVAAELAPAQVTRVEIPVTALSNGTSPVSVQLTTPLGGSVGVPVPLTARVTAFSGLGPLVTGGAALVLLSWWFSHFRRRHRERAARASSRSRAGHPSNGAGRAPGDGDGSSEAANDAAAEVSPDAAEAAQR
jgi:hypothetical protein